MSIEVKEMRVLDYLEGEMDAEQEAAFLAEAAADSELAALLEEYREQDRHLHGYFDAQASAVDAKVRRPDLEKLPVSVAARTTRRSPRLMMLAAAAALALVVGGSLYLRPQPHRAALESVAYTRGGAQAFVVGSQKPVAVEKSALAQVERLKTPSRAQLEVALTNGVGSLELRENSTLLTTQAKGAVELKLERGEVLVTASKHAAEQPVRVTTPYFEALASAPATFSVVKGIRGAEIAVVSGEVEVRSAGSRQTVGTGKSFSSAGSTPLPVADRIAWSRHYPELLASLPADIRTTTPEAEMSTGAPVEVAMVAPKETTEEPTVATKSVVKSVSFRPADTTNYLPEGTLSLIEVPSLQSILAERGASNMADVLLGGDTEIWVQSSAANLDVSQTEFEEISKHISEVFSNADLNLMLSSLAGSASVGLGPKGPFLVADVTDNLAEVSALVNGKLNPWLEKDSPKGGVRAVVANGRFVAGAAEAIEPVVTAVRGSSPTPFADSAFLSEVRRVAPGSRFTAALDAQGLMRSVSTSEQSSLFFRNVGLGNMQTVIAATNFADQAQNQALRITFDGPRQGAISWLDKPGPLSSFQYFTPDAHAVMAARIKRPGEMLNQFLGWVGPQRDPSTPEGAAEADLIHRLADTLGNEAAIGLDNPVLPIPNIKLAIEVLDPEGFHDGMMELMDDIATHSQGEKKVDVNASEYRDHLIVDFTYPGTPYGVSYAVVGDFVVLGPGRPFLQSTIDTFTEHQSLNEEYAFNQALPAKSGSHCSALMYVASNSSMGEAAPVLEGLLKQYHIPIDISGMNAAGSDGTKAAVYYAIAEENRIDVFIEGIRGNYKMTGLLPAVADWIKTNSR